MHLNNFKTEPLATFKNKEAGKVDANEQKPEMTSARCKAPLEVCSFTVRALAERQRELHWELVPMSVILAQPAAA